MSNNNSYKIGGRDFTLSPLVPRVEEAIVHAVANILEDMPIEVKNKLEKKDISKATPFELLDALGIFAVENQCKLIACVICPQGGSERDKNVLEIAEYLEDNLRFLTKIKIIHDFFVCEDIQSAAVLIRETWKKAEKAIINAAKQ